MVAEHHLFGLHAVASHLIFTAKQCPVRVIGLLILPLFTVVEQSHLATGIQIFSMNPIMVYLLLLFLRLPVGVIDFLLFKLYKVMT